MATGALLTRYSMSTLDDFKVDNLFLLVGTNPLPNYVAGRALLHSSEGSRVFLVYSLDTCEQRQHLEDALRQHGIESFVNILVEESNPVDIENRIAQEAAALKGRVGLNYTGGTKAMAVYSVLSLQKLHQTGKVPHVQFSYLDARTLRLVIAGSTQGTHLVGTDIQVTLKDLLILHSRGSSCEIAPLWPATASAIAAIHTQPSLRTSWHSWIATMFFKEPPWPAITEQTIDAANDRWQTWVREQFVLQEYRRRRWKSKTELEKTLLEVPAAFIDVEQALLQELGLVTQTNLRDIMRHGKFTKSEDVGKWFEGTWLESYVLSQVQELQRSNQPDIVDSARSIQAHSHQQVEIDVAFTRGYQLFGLSCTSSSDRGLCKSKLLEVVIRAEQLGGAEARAGLVCCSEEPTLLQQEVSDLFGKNVRVFGQAHLIQIKDHLARWIEDVSS